MKSRAVRVVGIRGKVDYMMSSARSPSRATFLIGINSGNHFSLFCFVFVASIGTLPLVLAAATGHKLYITYN